jgi:quercetin dioxygenase-like cupin family protein
MSGARNVLRVSRSPLAKAPYARRTVSRSSGDIAYSIAQMAGPYPYTIDNGGGERLTFSEVRSDEQGEYQEATNSVSPGSGPPMHVHHLQEESLTVERGTMGWQRHGEDEQIARSGETVTFAPG